MFTKTSSTKAPTQTSTKAPTQTSIKAPTQTGSVRDVRLGKHWRMTCAGGTQQHPDGSRFLEASVSFGPDRSQEWPDWAPKSFHQKDLGISARLPLKFPSRQSCSGQAVQDLKTPPGSKDTVHSKDQTKKEETMATEKGKHYSYA